MVKKLMVKVGFDQAEFFDGDCTFEITYEYGAMLTILNGKKEMVATFSDWDYWRYTDEK